MCSHFPNNRVQLLNITILRWATPYSKLSIPNGLRALLLLVCISLGLLSMPSTSIAQQDRLFRLKIETRILDFDPQPGMKSIQTVDVLLDTKKKKSTLKIKSSFETGVTEFGGIKLKSVRDNFTADFVPLQIEHYVRIKIEGETASGVRVLPNINYKFDLYYNLYSNSAFISGCHDGYPAYKISIGHGSEKANETLYNFKHKPKEVLKLFGSCDVKFKK